MLSLQDGMGLIPGQGTKMQPGAAKKKKKKEKKVIVYPVVE